MTVRFKFEVAVIMTSEKQMHMIIITNESIPILKVGLKFTGM